MPSEQEEFCVVLKMHRRHRCHSSLQLHDKTAAKLSGTYSISNNTASYSNEPSSVIFSNWLHVNQFQLKPCSLAVVSPNYVRHTGGNWRVCHRRPRAPPLFCPPHSPRFRTSARLPMIRQRCGRQLACRTRCPPLGQAGLQQLRAGPGERQRDDKVECRLFQRMRTNVSSVRLCPDVELYNET